MSKKMILLIIIALVIIATVVTIGILWNNKTQSSLHAAQTATAESDLEAWAGICQYVQITYHGASERNAEGTLWLFWWKDDLIINNFSPEIDDAVTNIKSFPEAQNILCVIEKERSLDTCSYTDPSTAGYRVTYDLTVYLIDRYNLELLRETFYEGESPVCPGVLPKGTIKTYYGQPSADLDEIMDWARQYWSP